MTRPLRILITSGDQDGIGFEVCAKALLDLGPRASTQYFLYQSHSAAQELCSQLKQRFQTVAVSSLGEFIARPSSDPTLIQIISDRNPADWVEESANACFNEGFDGLVTAPLSKTLIQKSGRKDIGHTDILKRVCRVSPVFMSFFGSHFNVTLLTGHIPVTSIEDQLTLELLRAAVNTLQPTLIKLGLEKKSIGILGLNPHAGDDGIIGQFDKRLKSWIDVLRTEGFSIEGPLVPDAAFSNDSRSQFSMFIALYHDQGLITFKALHGYSEGVQVSLGLPIVRTSVDHGTAKNLYGTNRADFGSMKSAIEMCLRLIGGSHAPSSNLQRI